MNKIKGQKKKAMIREKSVKLAKSSFKNSFNLSNLSVIQENPKQSKTDAILERYTGVKSPDRISPDNKKQAPIAA